MHAANHVANQGSNTRHQNAKGVFYTFSIHWSIAYICTVIG